CGLLSGFRLRVASAMVAQPSVGVNGEGGNRIVLASGVLSGASEVQAPCATCSALTPQALHDARRARRPGRAAIAPGLYLDALRAKTCGPLGARRAIRIKPRGDGFEPGASQRRGPRGRGRAFSV